MSLFKVVVSDYDYPDLEIEKSILEPIGAEVVGAQCKTGAGLNVVARNADAILIQYARVGRDTIEALKKCRVLCRYGAGVDIVDVKAAYEKGIMITNVPYYCIEEVACHALTLAFTLLRRIPMYDRSTKEGKWHWSNSGLPIHRFSSMTFGLVGFGRISHKLTELLKPFGFKIICYDPYVDNQDMKKMGVTKVDFDNLLTFSDAVSIHCPLTEDTRHLFGEEELSRMKRGAVLVNCARGPIINNKALYQALFKGWIGGAGLDDPEEEPAKLDNWDPRENPIFSLENCIVTPHAAYYSEESIVEARKTAAEEAAAVLTGRQPRYLVRP